jgi:uncharacterized membrane protein YfcA
MPYQPSFLAYALLLPAAAAAGFVDSVAGGGGIITLPALLVAGLPPHLALGTNKLQSSFGSLAATMRYRAAGLIDLREMWPGILATASGAAAGAAAVGAMDATFLKILIPILLLGIVAFLALSPRFGLAASTRRIGRLPFWIGTGLLLGFYDGFFGPGTGTFWAIALIGLAGLEMRSATAHTKAANFTSNVVSLGVFLAAGSVLFPLGAAMGAAQACGAFLGSRMVVARGAGFVRGMLLLMSGGIVVYVVLKYWVLR